MKSKDSAVRLLSVMCFPGAFCQLHMAENRCEGGILRRTGIDAEPDLFVSFSHMTDPHLFPAHSVFRTLDAVIILPAAEAIPH